MPLPCASIIILTYNNLEYTRQCVESVFEHSEAKDFELILVDNASSDGTQAYLQQLADTHPNVKVLLNEKNEGFARGNNLGAALAQGDFIVFLNNDTIVTEGWLPGLLSKLGDPKVGMVGPVTNSSGNETRIQVSYNSIAEMPAFARQLSLSQRGKTFEIAMLAFLCVALRREVYEEIGPLDERFGIGMFEDDDYALRLKAKGYKILCVEDVFIHHWGSASFSRLDASEFWSLFQHNLKQFEEKWGIHWLPHHYRLEFIPEQLRQLIDGVVGLSAKTADYHQQILGLQNLVSERDRYIADSALKMDALYSQVQERDQAIAEKDELINKTWTMVQERDSYIAEIARSRAWRLVQWMWRVRLLLIPHNSWLERLLSALIRPLRAWQRYGAFGALRVGLTRLAATRTVSGLGKFLAKFIPCDWKDYAHAFRQEYPIYDRSRVIVYTDDETILPEYPERRSLRIAMPEQRLKVSLISTVRNEAANVETWLDSLLKQTRLPDEIVICDGGSTDNTVALIQKHAGTFPIPIQLIEEAGANIARGRNIAIGQVHYDLISCADFGCKLDKEWLQNLILPFELDEKIDVSCGFSLIQAGNDFSRIAAQYFVPEINRIDPQQFIPSARNFAMRKAVWEQAGGYPEFLTFAGEDTLFALNAKLQTSTWAFVPSAVVYWQAPTTLRRLYRTFYRYARGDGEVGTFAYLYWIKVKELGWGLFKRLLGLLLLIALCTLAGLFFHPMAGWGVAIAALWVGLFVLIRKLIKIARAQRVSIGTAFQAYMMPTVINLAQPSGFAAGVANRPEVRMRQTEPYIRQIAQILDKHPERKGVIVYPPTHDWGFMFQRPHQMARGFARMGYVYIFYTKNEKTDCVVGFKEVEPGLYLCNVPWETFNELERPIVYIGQPWRNRELRYFNQPRVIYDHFDEIEIFSADPADHEALLKRAEIVLVTARRLMEKVKDQRPDAIFTPNGVDYEFVQSARPTDQEPGIPEDLLPIVAKNKPIIGYAGALAEWFDYGLLERAARTQAGLEFVLLGVSYDGSLERSRLLTSGLENIHWLGMKPYAELFNYAWHFSAGIIPFKINEITLSTTPVKLFEYMACELPVVATAMPEARYYEGVFIAEGGDDPDQSAANFVAQIKAALQAGKDPAYQALIKTVARQNTWESRVLSIIERLNQHANG
jgi:GT2 family glycosyltransferase/glycosyltransferase involved in cell wall biosynthesis